MDELKKKFHEKSSKLRKEMRAFIKANGANKVDTVAAGQVFGGMRGVKSMIWETSSLDPVDGIRFRGKSIPELQKLLPKRKGGKEPLPEGLFWLMLVGEVPTFHILQHSYTEDHTKTMFIFMRIRHWIGLEILLTCWV